MDAWIVWLVVACIFGAGELHTGGFFLAPFAVGAAGGHRPQPRGCAHGGSGDRVPGSFGAGLADAAPGRVRHRRLPPSIRTGAAALVGRPAMVIERIANNEGVGCVKIDGEVWTARSYDEDEVIDAGERVEVVEIRGATALVMH